MKDCLVRQSISKQNLEKSLERSLETNIEKDLNLKPPLLLTIITQFYPPDFAATGQLIQELALQLTRLGIQVQVFTGQPGYAFQETSAPTLERSGNLLVQRACTTRLWLTKLQGTKLWRSRIRGKGINGVLFFLSAFLQILKAKQRGDVALLTTAPPFLPMLGYLANLCFGLPYVCLIYDLYPDIAVDLDVVGRKHWLVKAWQWINCKVWQRSQGIIVLSPAMKERVQANCPEIRHKISVIHNWADPDKIVPIPKERNWFACQHHLVNQFTVLYSGNMGRCHDFDTILEAAKLLQNEKIQFVFIGDGAKRQPCLDQVQQMGLTNCRFLPYQEKDVLPYSLTACDLSLVSVSPGMEGLVAPSKLYGVLAAGRPVAAICEPQSYLRSLIASAQCGAAFQNGDGKVLAQFILLLANDPSLAEQMGKKGRSYLQAHFTPEIIAEQYANLLHQARLSPSGFQTKERSNASTFPIQRGLDQQ